MFRILRPLPFLAVLISSVLTGQPQPDDPPQAQGDAPEASSAAAMDTSAGAEAAPASEQLAFEGYLQLLAARARGEGVREATITAIMAGLTPNPRVIALDRSQPGTASAGGPVPPIASYLRSHVNAVRISRGKAMRATVVP